MKKYYFTFANKMGINMKDFIETEKHSSQQEYLAIAGATE